MTACTAQAVAPTPEPAQPVIEAERTSTWGILRRIAQAEDGSAPAILPRPNDTVFVWTGADDNEARLYAQNKEAVQRILALKAYYPSALTLYDGGSTVMMLWQDKVPNEDISHLLSATISPSGIAERDTLSVSRQGIRRYTAAPGSGGIVYTVFSTSEGIRSHLYFNRVDLQARPQQAELLRLNGDFPALVVDNGGNLHLYWIENERIVYYAGLDISGISPELKNVQQLATLNLGTGDAIQAFSVGFDSAYAHLFWNIRRATGRQDVVYTSGQIIAVDYDAPRRLGIVQQNVQISTSYNSHIVYQAQFAETNFASWAMPLAGQHETLPIAIQQDDWLGVAYFKEGEMVGYQDVIETGGLIGAPTISVDRDRYLYLTWSEPTTQGYANLFTTTSRPIEEPE